MLAARSGDSELVQVLAEAKANLNVKNISGATALIFSVRESHMEVTQFLTRQNANLNEQSNHGDTALIYAGRTGNEEVVRFLAEAKANINQKDRNGRTALYYAAKEGHGGTVETLVTEGAGLVMESDETWQRPTTLTALTVGIYSRLRRLLALCLGGHVGLIRPLQALVHDYALPVGWIELRETIPEWP
eukprot:g4049.t1